MVYKLKIVKRISQIYDFIKVSFLSQYWTVWDDLMCVITAWMRQTWQSKNRSRKNNIWAQHNFTILDDVLPFWTHILCISNIICISPCSSHLCGSNAHKVVSNDSVLTEEWHLYKIINLAYSFYYFEFIYRILLLYFFISSCSSHSCGCNALNFVTKYAILTELYIFYYASKAWDSPQAHQNLERCNTSWHIIDNGAYYNIYYIYIYTFLWNPAQALEPAKPAKPLP